MATSVGVIRHTTGVRSSAAGSCLDPRGSDQTVPPTDVVRSPRSAASAGGIQCTHVTRPARSRHLRARLPVRRLPRLRDEDPVSHHDHPGWERGYWVVTRHGDVQRVSRDWTAFRNAPNPFLPDTAEFDDGGTSLLLISLDPPEHTKLRKIISSGFTPRRINDLAGHVKARVDSVIDSVADRGECDLVKDIALWLPLHAIADLVGVPEDDRSRSSSGPS